MTKKAKRAILGLCDYDMGSDGTLTRIEPNRKGKYVFPKGCKKVGNSAIILRSSESKIVLGDTNILFEKNFAVYDLPPAYVIEANMELNLKGSRYTSIYSLINALDSLNVRGESFLHVHFVFDEKLITEQILSILCANKAGMRLYVQTTRTRIVAKIGETDIFPLLRNAEIFKKVYAEVMRFYNSSAKIKELLQEAVKVFKTFNDFVYKGAVKVYGVGKNLLFFSKKTLDKAVAFCYNAYMEGVMSEMYYPTNDIVFKKIFADPKNKDLLKSLLSATLKIDLALMGDLIVENPEIKPEHIHEKACVLDINLTVSGTSINIEMQVAKEEFFGDRELFYWGKLYTGKLEKGQDYGELRKSIVLAFVNHVMFEDFEDGYHSEYLVLEKTRHKPLSDKLNIHIFELPKFTDTSGEVDYEKLWLTFLKMNSLEAVEMLKNAGTPEIQKAIGELELLNGDEDFREMARMREKAHFDENSRIRGAELRGRSEALLETAKNFLKLGLSIPQIAAGTGLSEKEIQALA